MNTNVTINTRFGGSWQRSVERGDINIGRESMPLCVNKDILYDEFMEIVYKAHEINSTEWDIRAKAVFIDSLQRWGVPPIAANINNDITFKAFMNSNSLDYLSSMRSYCTLYLTIKRVGEVEEDVRPENDNHLHEDGETIPPFRSSKGSNPIPPMATQFQNIGQVQYTSENTSNLDWGRSRCNTEQPPLQQHLESSIWEHGVNVYEDDRTTMEGGISQSRHNIVQPPAYSSFEPNFVGTDVGVEREFRNVADEEETEVLNVCPSLVFRSSPVRAPSSSNQYMRFLPRISSDSTVVGDASSSNRQAVEVCVGHIFSTKQELRDKLGLMALNNHFQFRVYKSTRSRFEAKCIMEGCKWRIRAIKNDNDAYFQRKEREKKEKEKEKKRKKKKREGNGKEEEEEEEEETGKKKRKKKEIEQLDYGSRAAVGNSGDPETSRN
ncbi:MuDR family transposase [Melia azedarach]|uniref:MuDR family transposase n=1 Tax=Melia azedarach TaxID=155640 RepID=A0ACC1X1D0_MELAZ|nr:MuDR family transposase [Melia azedarach]